jgi:glycosyltransferase involved in cell wall biosynthesis
MIVKNEEKSLARCLDSVRDLVDEIIIVDTGSTDRTKEIAQRYTDQIYDFKWINHFAAARNFSFSKANMDYILWLDADDILNEPDRESFLILKRNLSLDVDSVAMEYHLELNKEGNPISSLRRNRLVKREKQFKWIGAVHEYLEVSGNVIISNIAITHMSLHHDAKRNLNIYQNLIAQGEQFSPRDLFYYANELFDHQKYEKALDYYIQFLDTKKGWVEDNITACGNIADILHELGDLEQELHYILKSFEYDTPRAELCCRLGYWFLKKNLPFPAIFWYKQALSLDKPTNNWGRINHACWTWLPHYMLFFCYHHISNYKLAYTHFLKAEPYLPDHPSIFQYKQQLEAMIEHQNLSDQAKTWLPFAIHVDEHFQPLIDSTPLKITWIMDHMNMCGGVKMVLEYSQYLTERGHAVTILSHDSKPNWMNVDVQYICVPNDEKLTNFIQETDIIITTSWVHILDCYQSNKAPVVHYEQGDTYLFEFEECDQFTQEKWRNYWSTPVPIITVSSGLAKQIEKYTQRKPKVINYGLNKDIFYQRNTLQPLSTPAKILLVGPEQWAFKGIQDILSALKVLLKQGRKIEPVWITQTAPKTDFSGQLLINPPQKVIGNTYRNCDIYVCASYFEGFGLPPLEAMTCGCAVITTRNIGVLEYAEHDKNCLLIDIGDTDGLARAITELLDNDDKRRKLIEGGYKTAKQFKADRVIDTFEQYLYGAIKLSNKFYEK